MSPERLARVVVGAFWLLAGFWVGLVIADLTGVYDVPIGALIALAVFIWAVCRCPSCALPVFYRPSGAPGKFKIRYFMATPERTCPRCGLRYKPRTRHY